MDFNNIYKKTKMSNISLQYKRRKKKSKKDMYATKENTVAKLGYSDKNELPAVNRSKRVLPALLIPLLGIGLKVIGIGLQIGSLVQKINADKRIEKNFQKVFEGLGRNLNAINKNYDAIKSVEEKVDRNFVVLIQVVQMVNETLLAIEKSRVEMQQGFNAVLEAIKKSSIEPTVSKLNHFIQFYLNEKQIIKSLSRNEYISKLKEQNNILLYLKDCRTPKANSLDSLLYDIINQNFAIPKDANDTIAFNALYVLYYGTQTYVSIMFFLLEQYSNLAEHDYQNGDFEEYNRHFDLVKTTFQDFKYSLVGDGSSKSLVDNVLEILRLVISKDFVEYIGENSFQLLSERIASITLVKYKLEQIELPIIADVPAKITGKPKFNKYKISTPIGQWKDGAKVSYAIQYKNNDTYSKVGEWSDPLTVNGNANPFLTIPIDPKRNVRLIFRKFNSDVPELVAVLDDKYQTSFRDIDRDFYNAACNFNEDLAIKEAEILINNGANVNRKFNKGRKAIHAAAQSDSRHIAQNFLISNNLTNIAEKDDQGFAPIQIAVEAGYTDFVKLLLQHGADVNSKTEFEKLTPLHIAAYKGYVSVIEMLMRSDGIDLNAKDQEGFTPLHSAVIGGVPAVRALLSNNTTDVNAKSKKEITPLHISSLNNYIDVTNILLENNNININAKSEGNLTALHFACIAGNLETVQVLINQKKININEKSVNGWTSLHFSVALKQDNIALELIKENVDTEVNVVGEGNITPLHLAATSGQKNVLLGLLKRGAAIENPTESGLTSLHIAAKNGNYEAISTLIDNEANIEAKTFDGLTPLHVAIISQDNNLNTTKYFINKGAQINDVSDSNETPLHLAVKSGMLDKVKFFLEMKYSINTKDKNGNTSLHIASNNGYLDIAIYLVANGADITAKNYFDRTVLHLAALSGNPHLVKFFVEKNADINAKDKEGCFSLYLATRNNKLDVVKYLSNSKNINLNSTNVEGETVIHLTALSGNLDLIKHFVRKGANYNAKNNNLLAPITLAAKNGHLNVIKYFVEDKDVRVNWICTFISRPLAAYNGYLEVVKYLTQKENSNLKSINNYVSLLAAAENGHLDIVKELLKAHVDVNLERKTDYLLWLYALKMYIIENHTHEEETNLGKLARLYLVSFNVLLNNGKLSNYVIFHITILSIIHEQWDILKYLLDRKLTDLNAKYEDGMTLLHYAAANGNLKIITYLTETQNVSFFAENKDGMTPLLFAVKNNHFDIVKYFFENGVNLTSSKRNPLLFAAANGNIDMVKYLFEKGAKINSIDKEYTDSLKEISIFSVSFPSIQNSNTKVSYYDNTPLCNAAKNGHLNIIRYLTENGADIHLKNENGYTPLHYAAKNGNFNMVKYLTNKGADINVINNDECSPLHYAAKNGHLDLVKYLTDRGANVDGKDKNYKTPVYYAAENSYLDIVKFLLEEKKAKNILPNWYEKFLENAVKKGRLDMVQYLTERGASFSSEILHNAAESGNLNIVKFLVEKGVSVHKRTEHFFSYDMTPLHYAAKKGNLEIVKYLIDVKYADANVKDNYNWTPLHYAANGGHLNIVQYLLGTKDVVPNIVGTDGKTPLLCAINKQRTSVIKYIFNTTGLAACRPDISTCLAGAVENEILFMVKDCVQHGANVNFKYSEGFLNPEITLLHRAVLKGNFAITKYLIDMGADVNAKSSVSLFSLSDLTPLHIAAEHDHLNITKYLMEKGANIDIKCDEGLTPLNLANICCSTSVSNFLKSKGSTHRRRSIEHKNRIKRTNSLYIVNESLALNQNSVASGTSKPSSWINNFATKIVNKIIDVSKFFYSSFKPAIGTTNFQSSTTIPIENIDINGALLLLNTLVLKTTNKSFISTPLQPISLLEATTYAINITNKFENIVKQAAKINKIDNYVEEFDFVRVQKNITEKILAGKFDEILAVLKLHIERSFYFYEANTNSKPDCVVSEKINSYFFEHLNVIINPFILETMHCYINNVQLNDVKQYKIPKNLNQKNCLIESFA